MINGEWGCGKTFFVEKTLMPHLREKLHMDVNYVSLYGISDLDAITDSLCVQAIKDKMYSMFNIKVEGKASELSSIASSFFIKNILPKLGINELDTNKIIGLLPDYNNNVIIFDDLERCGLDINEVLGYINGFIEHSNAAVIIVANEKEIGNWQLERNPELQMQVALADNLRIPSERGEYKNNRNFHQERGADKKDFTIKQLEERRAVIFHSNNKYLKMKEKVIGQTINYIPDLREAYMELIDKVQSNDYLRNQLKELVDNLVDFAKKFNHYNLRTFQFFLEKICIIYEAIGNKYSKIDYMIIAYTFQSSIRCMKGLPMPKWKGDFGTQFFGEKSSFIDNSINGFRFIDNLIYKNEFDSDIVEGVLTQYKTMVEEQGRLKNDPYQLLKSWWCSEDEEVKQWLRELKENVQQGKYSTMLYPDIVKQLTSISSYGVMVDQCDDIVDAMKKHIQKSNPSKLVPFGQVHFFPEDDSGKKFSDSMEALNKLMDRKIGQSERLKYKELLQSETWSEDLIVKEHFIAGYSFIFWIDPNELFEKISRGNNHELQNFRNALTSIYSDYVTYRNAAEDLDHLSELKKGIAEMDVTIYGEIKRLYMGWIKGDIERYMHKIKNQVS